MELNSLKKLYKAMETNGFNEMELEMDGEKVKMQLDARTYQVAEPVQDNSTEKDVIEKTQIEIRSDKVGIFSFADISIEPEATIKKGQTLGTIKGISFQDKIQCSVNGKLSKIAIEEGEVVDYGRLLFVVEID
jgi:biotin carboxyl carrier protein